MCEKLIQKEGLCTVGKVCVQGRQFTKLPDYTYLIFYNLFTYLLGEKNMLAKSEVN